MTKTRENSVRETYSVSYVGTFQQEPLAAGCSLASCERICVAPLSSAVARCTRQTGARLDN